MNILSIDPGREKSGVAILNQDEILLHQVIESGILIEFCIANIKKFKILAIAVSYTHLDVYKRQVPVFMLRDKNGKHIAQVHEPFYFNDTGNEEQDLYDITVKMTNLIESVIRENPSQWMWFQKRWNTPLNEEKQAGKHHAKKGAGKHE